jgi:hypothetical protein
LPNGAGGNIELNLLTFTQSPSRKGLSGRALRDSEGLLKPAWNRDVDPSHSAAA